MEKSLEDFYKLNEAEEYLKFFDIEYDPVLMKTKRLHILKKFGELVQKIEEQKREDRLELYRFSLLAIYKNFENGYSPSAAEIWNSIDKPSACLTCSTDC